MKTYVIIVRDLSFWKQSDDYLYALDLIYVSPIIIMNFEKEPDRAMDNFDNTYGKYFKHFLSPHYQLIPV